MEAAVAKAVTVVREMLLDRGEGLGELEAIGDDEVRRLVAAHDFFHIAAADLDVVFVTRKLKTQDIQKAAATLDEERRDRAIVVTIEQPGVIHRNAVEAHFGPRAETFSLQRLQYNVSRHALVPPHERLSDGAVQELLATYMLPDKRALPSIQSSDPVAKYLGLRPGDVVKVTRPSASAGTTTFYRHCVKGP